MIIMIVTINKQNSRESPLSAKVVDGDGRKLEHHLDVMMDSLAGPDKPGVREMRKTD